MPDWFVLMRRDVSFQLCGAKRIAQLVQRSARDLEEPCELLVLAPKTFRDIAAHGIRRIFRLRVELEIAPKARSIGQLEHQDPYLIGKLPDNQVLVPSCSSHVGWESTARASTISLRIDSAMTKPCKIRNFGAPRSAHLLHRPESTSHRPDSTSHRPEATLHRLGSTSHRLGSTSHRPGSTSHRPAHANHF